MSEVKAGRQWRIILFLRARFEEEKVIADRQPTDWNFTVLEWSGPNDLVALFTPTRVLAEVEAKQRILDRAQFIFDRAVDLKPGMGFIAGAEVALRDTLRDLAQPYAKHPDYDPAWGLKLPR